MLHTLYLGCCFMFAGWSHQSDEDERIHSTFCRCRGGIDSKCCHIVALLFQIRQYLFWDQETISSTSKPCAWNVHGLCQDKEEDPVQMIEIKNSVEKKNSQFNRVSPQLGLEKKNFSKLSRKIIIGGEAWPGRCAHCHISEMGWKHVQHRSQTLRLLFFIQNGGHDFIKVFVQVKVAFLPL